MAYLDIVLSREMYDRVERGEKDEIYKSSASEYWTRRFTRRLLDHSRVIRTFDAVRIHRAATETALLVEWKGTCKGVGRVESESPEENIWIIKLGKRIGPDAIR